MSCRTTLCLVLAATGLLILFQTVRELRRDCVTGSGFVRMYRNTGLLSSDTRRAPLVTSVYNARATRSVFKVVLEEAGGATSALVKVDGRSTSGPVTLVPMSAGAAYSVELYLKSAEGAWLCVASVHATHHQGSAAALRELLNL